MAVLSPRLLLEIKLDPNPRRDESLWRVKDEVPADKYAEFRR